jgi:hypothetical protein
LGGCSPDNGRQSQSRDSDGTEASAGKQTPDPNDPESCEGTKGDQLNKHAQLPKIFVDFHNSDEHGRVRLNTVGTIEDLNRLGFVLCEGAEVLLYSYEVETEGTVTYSAEEGLWVANFDAKNVRDKAGDE